MNKLYSAMLKKHYIFSLILMFILCIITSLAAILQIVNVAELINSVQQGYDVVINYFIRIIILFVICIITENISLVVKNIYVAKFSENLRNAITEKICMMPYVDIERFQDGDVISIINSDSRNMSVWLENLYTIGHLPVKIGVALFLCFLYSWQISIVMIPMAPLAMLVPMLISKRLYNLELEHKKLNGKLNVIFVNMLRFLDIIKSYNIQNDYTERNKNLMSENNRVKYELSQKNHFIYFFGTSFGHVGSAMILLVGAYLIFNNNIMLGDLYSVILFGGVVGEAINILLKLPSNYNSAKASLYRINKIMDIPDSVYIEEQAGKIKTDNLYTYKLDNVSFGYDENKPILQDFSVLIKANEKIAVVGKSGSGKTTLFKILCGLYPVNAGEVRLFGQNIRENPELLSVMPQESYLFPSTIWENLTISCPNTPMEKVIEVCKRVGIYEKIQSMEKGFDTEILNINRSLSRGQIQRLSLAATILRNSNVLLLDEPTSALDLALENQVIDYVLDESNFKTVIMILHHLIEPERFDRILFLADGKILGFDSHCNLMTQNETYRRMIKEKQE